MGKFLQCLLSLSTTARGNTYIFIVNTSIIYSMFLKEGKEKMIYNAFPFDYVLAHTLHHFVVIRLFL